MTISYTPPEGTEELIRLMDREYNTWHHSRGRRGQHAKGHGILRCTLEVDKNLPQDMQCGPLVPGAVYDGLIRFSNGNRVPHSDNDRDVRGAAFKFFIPDASIEPDILPNLKALGITPRGIPDGADVHTWDIIGASSHNFFARDAAAYIDLMTGGPLKFVFPHRDPKSWRLREAWNLFRALQKPPGSPTELTYSTQLPIKFGDRAVKLEVSPIEAEYGDYWYDTKDPNRLRYALVQQLRPHTYGVTLVIYARMQGPNDSIEDPCITWRGPSRYLASITIPAQEFDTPENDALDRVLSWSPWHAPEALQPLGQVMNLRRMIYRHSLERRLADDGLTAASS